MPAAPVPVHEADRLRALHDYDVLDTPPEASFDELVALAAQICEAPISLVSFIDRDRQWFKARYGLTASETPRSVSFCAHAIAPLKKLLIVPDATRDSRFADNPLVRGEAGIRFYAGVPLRTPEGEAIGTLCVLDRRPRNLAPKQQEALLVLGRQAMAQLELRRRLNESVLNKARLENSQRIAGLGDWDYDFFSHRLLWSKEVYRILGLTIGESPPDAETFYRCVHPDDLARVHREKKAAAEGSRSVDFEHRIIRPDGKVRHIHQATEMTLDNEGRPALESGIIQDITERKLSEEALRASESRFHALSDSAPLGIFQCDRVGRVIYYNPALTALTGQPAERSLGQGWEMSIHPDDRDAVAAGWALAVSEGRTWEQEQRLLQPDGSVCWVHTLAAPTRDIEGQVNGFVGTVEDVTERRAASAAMFASEARYRELLMFSPDANFVHVNGLITLVNRAFCKLMGAADPAQLLGMPALQVAHPDFRELVRQRQRQHFEGVPIPSCEMKFARLDGTIVDVEVNAMAFDFLGRKEVLVIARDISARKLAETALRESEERFRLVARAVSDAVWDWNISARTAWWNDSFLSTFGFAAGELEPGYETWVGCIHPDDRKRVIDSVHRAIDGDAKSWSAEYRIKRKDDSYAFVLDRGYVVRDAAGKGVRMVGGIRDLTEQKKMEAENLRAQRMDSIGTLASGIAHDLNNVLAPIMMSIELLKIEEAGDPRRSRILNTIHNCSQRGADLVRQILSFARGAGGQRGAIPLRPLIDELNGIISGTFPGNVRIVTEISDDLWPVIGDPSQLHQVLLNFAVNARDAMPKGGTFTLAAANIDLDARFVGSHAEAKIGAYVLLQVSDTGEGMRPEIRKRIFEPFFTTKETGKGTGIGLATVHAIVKSHGGFLCVESELGQGTTFKVYLPADSEHRATDATQRARAEPPRGRGELVLVVDDEFSIRSITQQTLEAFGYRVLTADNGADAVALFAKQPSDIALVLTDMMLPVMDGAATIRAIRLINPSVRIIATSGVDSADAVVATSVGVTHLFLLKPYTAEILLNRIREALDQPALSIAF